MKKQSLHNSKVILANTFVAFLLFFFLGNTPVQAGTCTVSVDPSIEATVYQNMSAQDCLKMGGTPSDTSSETNSSKENQTNTSKEKKYFIPGMSEGSGIQDYIKAIYTYAIGMVGLLATIVIMIGGLIWVSSMGNASRVSNAKDWIGAALSGLALALFSYMILWIINPDLVKFKPLDPQKVDAVDKPVEPAISSKIHNSLLDCQAECKSPNICQAGTAGGYNCVKEINFDRDTNSIQYPTTNACKEYEKGSFQYNTCCEYNNCNGTDNDEYNQGWIEG